MVAEYLPAQSPLSGHRSHVNSYGSMGDVSDSKPMAMPASSLPQQATSSRAKSSSLSRSHSDGAGAGVQSVTVTFGELQPSRSASDGSYQGGAAHATGNGFGRTAKKVSIGDRS